MEYKFGKTSDRNDATMRGSSMGDLPTSSFSRDSLTTPPPGLSFQVISADARNGKARDRSLGHRFAKRKMPSSVHCVGPNSQPMEPTYKRVSRGHAMVIESTRPSERCPGSQLTSIS